MRRLFAATKYDGCVKNRRLHSNGLTLKISMSGIIVSESQTSAKVPIELAAAFIVVRLSEEYTFPEQVDGIFSASLAVLASWGYSTIVQNISHLPRATIVRALVGALSNVETSKRVMSVAFQQPFCDESWQPPDDGQLLPKAVAALAHDWQPECGGPWRTHAEVVQRAVRYCADVADTAQRMHGARVEALRKLYNDCNGDLDRAALGALLADWVSPNTGSTVPVALCRCGTCDEPTTTTKTDVKRRRAYVKHTNSGRRLLNGASSFVSKRGTLDMSDKRSKRAQPPRYVGNSTSRFDDTSRSTSRSSFASACTGND